MGKQKTLIFDLSIDGHHLEYIHHIYDILNHLEVDYVFVLPETFHEKEKLLKWNLQHKKNFDFINFHTVSKIANSTSFIRKLRSSLLVRRYVKKHKPQHVILLDFPCVMPFLPFILPKGVFISGIIYRIFFYEWNRLSYRTKIKDVIETKIMAYSNNVHYVYVLNDMSAAAYYQRRYHTNKFVYIPDPYLTNGYKPKNIREEWGIDKTKTIILHIGGLTSRKGTLTILDAISLMPSEKCLGLVFVFAGELSPKIESVFLNKVGKLREKVQIIFHQGFMPYEDLIDCCYTSDIVLLPYQAYGQSSGIFGHAVNVNKPVIGPAEGVLGKMIRKYPLGIAISNLNAHKLAKAIIDFKPVNNISNNYLSHHSISQFQKVISNSFK